MILNYPTGFFESVLPTPTGGGNVTFTCSADAPPRSTLSFFKVGSAGDRRRLGAPCRRRDLASGLRGGGGQLVYTVARSSQSAVQAGMKQYEAGEVLDFAVASTSLSASTSLPELGPQRVQDVAEIRHDTNDLDLAGAGLDNVDIEVISSASAVARVAVMDRLNSLSRQYLDLEGQIGDVQKSLNEAQKISDGLIALSAITGSLATVDKATASPVTAVQRKVAARIDQLNGQLSDLVAQANQVGVDNEVAAGELLALSQLVR